ncbi:flagellar basal body rod protein FlgC [Roseitalea porphyridii]|uniref:Flagellar basal-body rod protein FlgC n=1 Tax=Roseitalea porphyridii TaxID=1852022 RepID=A0A4P6V1D0_9HYPH|nr:flagellar basal body rod protein FlgC [Roseitalea porphyridii]QBK30484.1 flagellar basal body rod protein FlgC [Roseitalea porphyridii]
MDALTASLKVAGSGLHAESTRLRVVSENIANASSTGDTPGADPYARKTIAFQSALDRASQVSMVEIDKIGVDRTAFVQEFDPSHPAADPDGYVKLPNVNPIVEMADMREANRSYQANLQVLKQARELISMTIDLMRGR